jgi:hypothetical protein
MTATRLALAMAALSLQWWAAPTLHAQPTPAAGQEISVGAAKLLLVIPPGEFPAPALLNEWALRSARIVAHYYGRFPVAAVRIVLIPVEGSRVAGGTTFGRPAAVIRVRVGKAVDAAALRNDWVLVHEMTHLALPDVGDEHAWLSEGLAVYIEGVARVQSGNRTIEDVFAEEQRSMPRGLPNADDPGLDHDHSWGRTYWGGALFCLLADVGIRQRTANRFGLQDAMQAVLRASGGLPADWDIGKVLATADAAVGVPVMSQSYARMKDQPYAPDLAALWRSLGVEAQGNTVRINDQAPLAAIRKAIFKSP